MDNQEGDRCIRAPQTPYISRVLREIPPPGFLACPAVVGAGVGYGCL